MQSVSRKEEVRYLGENWERTFHSENCTDVLSKFRGKVTWKHLGYNERGPINITEVTDENSFKIEEHGVIVSKRDLERVYQDDVIDHDLTY